MSISPENEKNEYIEGSVSDIVFQNDENGYTVAAVDTDNESITVVGVIPMLCEGEYIKAFGKWTNHATFGKQFAVETYEKSVPGDEKTIYAYLSSGIIKGVGAATALRIVEKYGKDTLDVLEKNPEWLTSVKGITAKKAQAIGESYAAQFGVRNVLMFFSGQLSPTFSYKIYKRWGAAAIEVVKANPYILCEEIYGIGFEKADKIAESLGIDKNSEFRLSSGIKYVLRTSVYKNGHCYLPLETLVENSVLLLDANEPKIIEAITLLTKSGELIAVRYGDITAIYTDSVYKAERYCAEKLTLLNKTAIIIPPSDKEQAIAEAEEELGISFDTLQRRAVECAVTNGVSVVTGGPGTGKTTVIRAIIKIFDRLEVECALAAPTGRASKRMSESTKREAKTLHRLLESEYAGDNELHFGRDETNPLKFGAVIIDEMSMTDIFLLAALLKAIKAGTKLILIGDADQLPPVGAGDALRDIIKSECFSSVELQKIFRQNENSFIVTNAHLINKGKMPVIDNKSDDFFFISRLNGTKLSECISELCKNRLSSAYNLNPMSDIQVITPTHKGYGGTVNLNGVLQEALNPRSDKVSEKTAHGVIFRVGDKVMQIRNNYTIKWISKFTEKENEGIFNGEIGIIKSIDIKNEIFKIEFDEKIAEYDFTLFDEIEHAYAVTVHKSQGSEYPCVILSLFDAPPALLTRNMLYTALTRAQSIVVLVGDTRIMQKMVENNSEFKRNTGLMPMLKKLKDNNPQQ